MKDYSKFYQKISKLMAIHYGNYSITTEYKYVDSKSQEAGLILNDFLMPVLTASTVVYLLNYSSDWLDDMILDKDYPKWIDLIDECVEVRENLTCIKPECLDNPGLLSFWVSPILYGEFKSTGKRGAVQPGQVVIEIPAADVPVIDISKHVVAVSSTSGFFSGNFSAAEKWIVEYCNRNKNNILIPYKNLGSLTFFGSKIPLEVLIENIMAEGEIMNRFEEFCPSLWLKKFDELDDDWDVSANKIYSFLTDRRSSRG